MMSSLHFLPCVAGPHVCHLLPHAGVSDWREGRAPITLQRASRRRAAPAESNWRRRTSTWPPTIGQAAGRIVWRARQLRKPGASGSFGGAADQGVPGVPAGAAGRSFQPGLKGVCRLRPHCRKSSAERPRSSRRSGCPRGCCRCRRALCALPAARRSPCKRHSRYAVRRPSTCKVLA